MLKKIYEFLNEQNSCDYTIPKGWNYLNVDFKEKANENEISVNANEFFGECINSILNYKTEENDNSNMVVYSMLPRTFSARYDHENKKVLDGTLLTSIALLPILKKLGVNTICILPIYQTSDAYKKGEVGSPYSIKNIMKLDPLLHDELLNGFSVDDEFKAFVEACHCLGIKIMLDFVFRTVSRDSELILENPDWFYWIKAEAEKNFKSPDIEGIEQCSVTKDIIKKLYSSKNITEYISKFAYPPTKDEWEKAKINAEKENINVFDYWKNNFGAIVVPGFPDTINDPQPAWDDVTFPKFYFDNSPIINDIMDLSVFPPFIAQDGVKSSVGSGTKPNNEMWDYTKNIIPYYIDKFEIDGARIDMAHALPTKLNEEIIQIAKTKKSDFILWSEEFNVDNSLKAKTEGYSFLTGGIWNIWDKINNDDFVKTLSSCVNSSLPVLTCLEMADTPRALHLFKEKYESMLYLSMLLTNTVVLVNNGQEFGEIQPMNLGLNNTEQGKFVLEKTNPLYGKLAFFDHYCFDWNTNSEYFSVLSKALEIRENYFNIISQNQEITLVNNLIKIENCANNHKIIAYFNFTNDTKSIDFENINKSKIIISKNYSDENILKDGFVIFNQ